MKRKMIIGLLALGLTAGVGTTALANGNGFNFPNMHNTQNGFGMMNWTDQEYNMGHMFDNRGDFEEMGEYMNGIHPHWNRENMNSEWFNNMDDYMNGIHPHWNRENMNSEWFNNMDDFMNGTPFQGEDFEQMYNTCHGNN